MEELTRAQKGRIAIRNFKVIADALAIRGFYRPNGRFGRTMEKALRTLSPEIYGSMNDPRRIELSGLQYVIDRLPRGIESCNRIVLTAQEEFIDTPFEAIQPLKRRRISYRVSEREICFVITRGLSEIYDILTHLTFLNIEARKLFDRIINDRGVVSADWHQLETHLKEGRLPRGKQLDQAIWDLSILVGRTFTETREAFSYFEKRRREKRANSGLFHIIYGLGQRMLAETKSSEDALMVNFTPSLQEMIVRHKYGENWARAIRKTLLKHRLASRPIHIVSANMHSVVNLLYAYAAIETTASVPQQESLYQFVTGLRTKEKSIKAFARRHGCHELNDDCGTQICCQIIDTAELVGIDLHPDLPLCIPAEPNRSPVLVVMDYAFGIQAFEVMDEMLAVFCERSEGASLEVESISIMGKAGILSGQMGDIMLATSFVLEGSTDNYIVDNELTKDDFPECETVYVGPMVTVLGTSLQNRDILERFLTSSWQAVGLEMEGGHYQRAISAAVIRGHIAPRTRLRYAYYASDNPLISGETLASGSMGDEGIRPTYMITKAILKKIFK